MRGAAVDEQNRHLLARQRRFRIAADAVADAFTGFDEVAAVAVTGSVARPLWKELPRFRRYRNRGIELWHECGDLDLLVWLDSFDRLGALRRAGVRALPDAPAPPGGLGVADHQLDVFLVEPGSDRYLGRLCHFRECPKGKPDCRAPGCGAVPFRKVVPGFAARPDLLADARLLYRRGAGRLASALDLPARVEP